MSRGRLYPHHANSINNQRQSTHTLPASHSHPPSCAPSFQNVDAENTGGSLSVCTTPNTHLVDNFPAAGNPRTKQPHALQAHNWHVFLRVHIFVSKKHNTAPPRQQSKTKKSLLKRRNSVVGTHDRALENGRAKTSLEATRQACTTYDGAQWLLTGVPVCMMSFDHMRTSHPRRSKCSCLEKRRGTVNILTLSFACRPRPQHDPA